jgi:hypothetical protein
MFNPKKMIPALAAGVFALTGCGGSDGGSGGSSGSGGSGGTAGTGGGSADGLAEAVSTWCMQVVDCFPGDYGSVQECVNYITEYYGIGDQISAACEAAAISYFECGANLSCDQLELYYNDCDEEFDAAANECT